MSGVPNLPQHLPASFGNDSPFPPPAATPRIPSAAFLSSASAPPLPPSRDEALDRERMLRQREYERMHTVTPQAGPSNGGGLRPGQIIPSTAYVRQAAAAPVAPHLRMVSPVPASQQRMPASRNPRLPPKNPVQQQRRVFSSPAPAPAIQRPQSSEPATRTSKTHHANNATISSTTMHSYQRLGVDTGEPQRRRVSSDDGARRLADPQREARVPIQAASPPPSSSPELNVVLPDLKALGVTREQALASRNDKRRLAWCKDVIKYIERKSEGTKISDPVLVQYIDEAIGTIDRLASGSPPLPEALYLRGDLLASGAFPAYHRKSLKQAFSDFELSARMGHAPSWFRIGRDYEILNDHVRAKDAYERGCSVRDVGCIYRMGMAHLLGQLGLGMNHDRAIPLLREAADLANLDTPQPSYIYGMLLAGEFSHVEVASRLLVPAADPAHPNQPATIESEARRRIQRAAYLNFGPAQYRCGWSYEYALLECPFDPLLSVQYYSLASQAGEVEADLALSKWFLCGAEGCFDKNEGLAFTFADKAARKGLPSAEFAMGYYFEVGVGCDKSIDVAQSWYGQAATHGNMDAQERLTALQGPTPSSLSRRQHEVHVDTQLQRKRTEAKMKSDRKSKMLSAARDDRTSTSASESWAGGHEGVQSAVHRPTDVRRRMTMRLVEETASKHYQPRERGYNGVSSDFDGRASEWDRRGSAPAPSAAAATAARPAINKDKTAGLNRLAIPASGLSSGNHSPTPRSSPQTATRPIPKTKARPAKQGITSSNSAPSGMVAKTPVSDYSSKNKFETFGEMGFSAKKTKVRLGTRQRRS